MTEDPGRVRGTTDAPIRQEAASLSVMTFNIRYDCADSPPGDPDHWPDRAPVVARLLRAERPALLGVQEALFPQVAALLAALPGYASVGYGRDGGSRSEHSSVLYDPQRLSLIGWDQQWLSDTPRLIGSTSWGHDLPRILVRCDFVDQLTGASLRMINTHLDHVSELARRRGAEQIAAEVAGWAGPVVITGDFNCAGGDSAPWQVLVDARLADSWLVAGRRESADTATWHGYDQPALGGSRIDWIMTSADIAVTSTKINTFNDAGRWPSDHCPVQAELVLP